MGAEPSHVAELLATGAMNDAAKRGLAVLQRLPAAEAWWLALDALARRALPATLERVPDMLSHPMLRRSAEALISTASKLRNLAPLPSSNVELIQLLHEAQSAMPVQKQFLRSLCAALNEPGAASMSGPLYMALFRWPVADSSGHILAAQSMEPASCATLEALTLLAT